MKKYLFIAATAIVALASCSDESFVGNNSPNEMSENGNGAAINFGLSMQQQTRGNIYGPAAAEILGNNFYVTGTKGEEQNYYPTPTVVFDNYLVHYGVNTAGTTESNTANWEYVGIDQNPSVLSPSDYERVKLSSINGAQTIKYWDYSVPQYDFFGFSTGTKKAVSKTNLSGSGTDQIASDEIGVTAMVYGSNLNVESSSVPTAYTFYIPSLEGLQNTYITDITEVARDNYGKEVQLQFKNLGSKIRVALYETVPGYSVKNVKFYKADAGASPSDLGVGTVDNANLIGANDLSFATKGTVEVRFQHVGNNHSSKQDYNKAEAQVTPVSGSYDKFKDFGALTAQLKAKERDEAGDNNVFLGRTLPTASFAGDAAASFYKTVFPNTFGYPLTLRVDYTLVPIDGAAEVINVKGAKAIVPSTYTRWLPNYAYTYIFKISDNTNGWTGAVDKPSGLFPITFDAVVTEATDATYEQKTITTVSAPSITTYQQNHDLSKDEYSKATEKDVYVQVMKDGALVADLNSVTTGTHWNKSYLYAISDADATEAEVVDALEKRMAALNPAKPYSNVTGRNGIDLINNEANLDNTVTSIVNGPDDNPITQIQGVDITAGQVAKINMSGLTAGTYAYVYDYTTAGTYAEVTEYQPIDVNDDGTIGVTDKTYWLISYSTLDGITTTTADNEAVDNDYIYFSKTTNGTGNTTYSYISVAGKTNLPGGLIKVAKTSLSTKKGEKTAVADTFYFDRYFSNKGLYAVKVIKVVN